VDLRDFAQIAASGAATVVLAIAAFSDVRSRRIPNWTVIALLALFAVLAVAFGGRGLVSALAAAGLTLLVTLGLYAFRWIGAGDSKLLTVVALFAGLGYLPLLMLATALTGGVIAAVSFISRPTRALTMVTLKGKGDWGGGVPYGVAIAVGGVLVIWAPMTDFVRPVSAPRQVTSVQLKSFIATDHSH
jgi:prepilin peptidase CpaA